MKDKDLTFLEAVRALKEGRCEGFRRKAQGEGSFVAFGKNSNTCVDVISYNGRGYLAWSEDNFLATDFELINPRPKTEPVEEKRWMFDSGIVAKSDFIPHPCEPGQWVTVKYNREVPEPEAVEFRGIVSGAGKDYFIVHFKDSHGFYSLSNKRVRCIVED